ncbi:MAG: hypothetical protein H0X31_14205 [Nostocaceae cyanobacterium]|nr:hypothetical protein [Nostocaceae cyanobacterium]
MPDRVNDVFKINASILKTSGIFNGFIAIDSPFYVDPRLLEKTTVPELKNSYKKFLSYFEALLEDIEQFLEGKGSFEAISRKLLFSEIPLAGLGYAINNTGGKGIGVQLSASLAKTAVELAKAGIIDPMIFELSGLFERGIGADRISDMTIHIVLPELAQFSYRVAKSLKLPLAPNPTPISGRLYNLPCYLSQGVLLVPEDILTPIPLAYSWTDVDTITVHNEKLREYINKMINKSWRHYPTWKEVSKKKEILKMMVLDNPEIMRELLSKYKSKSAKSYNFENDPEGEFRWHDNTRNYAKEFPLNLQGMGENINEQIIDVMCKHFSILVKRGLCTEFYKESGQPNSERRGQLVLLELLENYTKGSHLEVSYDSKTGIIKLYKLSPYQEFKILLKYLCTRGLCEYYDDLLKRAEKEKTLLENFLLIFIRTNNTNLVDAQIFEIDRMHSSQGLKIPKKFKIDGRIELIQGKKRPFR